MNRPQIDFLRFKTQNVISIMVVGFIIVIGILSFFVKLPSENKDLLTEVIRALSPIIVAITVINYGGKKDKTE